VIHTRFHSRFLHDSTAPGTAAFGAVNFSGQTMVTLSFYMYGDQAAATVARETPIWQAWIDERFPAASEANR
jgi:hypothetical protein